MASPTMPERPAGPDHDPDEAPRRRLALWATLAGVAVLISGWVYVLFVYDPGLMIDELADPTFPTAAEQVCARHVAELEALPRAEQASSADDRAATVARSNVVLRSMITELRPLVPAGPTDVRDGLDEWLDDWTTYIEDRQDYVERLEVDDEARFLETTKGSDTRGITRAINAFAQVNRMDSCTTPGDLS